MLHPSAQCFVAAVQYYQLNRSAAMLIFRSFVLCRGRGIPISVFVVIVRSSSFSETLERGLYSGLTQQQQRNCTLM
ncbi:hypothetical protein BIW11_07188 [Tropilaelaps mercedesae]|uniref:Uncharacterized protein n=1 Tax=Tropilaelaps mercedesae TaxID=418985 RepID=A0A1V9XUY0_9ACAR|nr:hypothetical protein BIW11_07188 [Tropilaelaps mercedesae]